MKTVLVLAAFLVMSGAPSESVPAGCVWVEVSPQSDYGTPLTPADPKYRDSQLCAE